MTLVTPVILFLNQQIFQLDRSEALCPPVLDDSSNGFNFAAALKTGRPAPGKIWFSAHETGNHLAGSVKKAGMINLNLSKLNVNKKFEFNLNENKTFEFNLNENKSLKLN